MLYFWQFRYEKAAGCVILMVVLEIDDQIEKRGYAMKTTIRSGNLDIVESNIFFMDNPESDVWIHLVIDDEAVGDIKISFLTDDQDENYSVQSNVQNGVLNLKFINFNSRSGIGSTEKWHIGYLNGKKIYIHLWAYILGEDSKKTRKIEYSIFRER